MCKVNLDTKDLIEIWKEAVEVQMHFNDLLIKMRTTVISIILAVFGGAAIAVKEINWYVNFLGFDLRLSAAVVGLGMLFLSVQYIIDRYYYFPLLLGAVKYTASMGERNNLPELSNLTLSIIKEVPDNIAKRVILLYYLIPFVLGVVAIYFIQLRLAQII
ncbi:MAG: hypothetical protein WC543_05255 [Candidatus Omnitrophota bacterium]